MARKILRPKKQSVRKQSVVTEYIKVTGSPKFVRALKRAFREFEKNQRQRRGSSSS
jgi:hypothetical protein